MHTVTALMLQEGQQVIQLPPQVEQETLQKNRGGPSKGSRQGGPPRRKEHPKSHPQTRFEVVKRGEKVPPPKKERQKDEDKTASPQ